MARAQAAGRRQHVRDRLLRAAVRRVERGGPEALQARSLTESVGTSTQAIYTHFGGMPGLVEAVADEGFARLDAHVRTVPLTDDPVADFFTQGWAYSSWGHDHPRLYRLMFAVSGGALHVQDAVGGTMTGSVERMQQAGRIDPADPELVAAQFLSATHGFILLSLAGGFEGRSDGVAVIGSLAVNLTVGLGDARAAAERSFAAAAAAAR